MGRAPERPRTKSDRRQSPTGLRKLVGPAPVPETTRQHVRYAMGRGQNDKSRGKASQSRPKSVKETLLDAAMTVQTDAPRVTAGTVSMTVPGVIRRWAPAGVGGWFFPAVLRGICAATRVLCWKATRRWTLAATANPTSWPTRMAIRRLVCGVTCGGTCRGTSGATLDAFRGARSEASREPPCSGPVCGRDCLTSRPYRARILCHEA